MTGRVVYEPTGEHYCDVMFRPGDNGCGTVSFDHPAYWSTPGSVLECDCGRTFVAQYPRGGEMFPRWRREAWFARWRRERRQGRAPVTDHGLEPPTKPNPSRPALPLPPSAAIAPAPKLNQGGIIPKTSAVRLYADDFPLIRHPRNPEAE